MKNLHTTKLVDFTSVNKIESNTWDKFARTTCDDWPKL